MCVSSVGETGAVSPAPPFAAAVLSSGSGTRDAVIVRSSFPWQERTSSEDRTALAAGERWNDGADHLACYCVRRRAAAHSRGRSEAQTDLPSCRPSAARMALSNSWTSLTSSNIGSRGWGGGRRSPGRLPRHAVRRRGTVAHGCAPDHERCMPRRRSTAPTAGSTAGNMIDHGTPTALAGMSPSRPRYSRPPPNSRGCTSMPGPAPATPPSLEGVTPPRRRNVSRRPRPATELSGPAVRGGRRFRPHVHLIAGRKVRRRSGQRPRRGLQARPRAQRLWRPRQRYLRRYIITTSSPTLCGPLPSSSAWTRPQTSTAKTRSSPMKKYSGTVLTART